MKSVVLCGSRRYKEEILAFGASLRALGVSCAMPFLNERSWEEIPEDFQTYAALGLTLEQFRKIDLADVTFVYNKRGYAGVSTTLEIGYAVGRKKPIYAFEPDTERTRNVLYSGFTETAEALARVLA